MTTIIAPRDGFILDIKVPKGTSVKEGTIICEFDGLDEQIAESGLMMIEEMMLRCREAFGAERAALINKVEEATRKASESHANACFKHYEVNKEKYEQGLIESYKAKFSQLKAKRAETGLARSKVARTFSDALLVQGNKMLDQVDATLSDERQIVAKKKKLNLVLAPASGDLTWLVHVDGFVRQGDVFGYIK